ncbi:transposase [Herpetosiphon giganteus]|nr:transposase [Herpetosiphon giganteus]
MMRTLTRCYTYRLQPTPGHVETLVQWAGCRCFIWNWALHCKQTHYQTTGQRLRYSQLAAALVDLKRQPKTAFLRECHS